MKKNILLFLLLLFAMATTKAQLALDFTVAPVVCYNSSGNNYAYASLTQTSGASSYSWTVGSPIGCAAGYTPAPGGAGINIEFPCCGTYTVNCYASNGGTASHTVSLVCPANITIGGPTYVCAGSSATLTASGASSYTWQPGYSTGASIVVTPTANTCYTVAGNNATCGTINYAAKCITVGGSSTLNISGPNSICAGSTATLVASGAASYTWQPGNLTGTAIAVNPSVTTCYTVSGYNPACGTINYGFICVTVNNGSALTVSGPSVICAGSSATLMATGATSIVWQPGNLLGNAIVVTPTATTCYTVSGYDPVCGMMNYALKCVTVGSSSVPVGGSGLTISGPNVICAGSSATLTASGATNYTWQPGGIFGPSIIVTPTANACYTVSGYDFACGATNSAVKCITVGSGSVLTVSGPSVVCAGSSATLMATGATSIVWQPGNLSGNNVVVTPTANTCYTVSGYDPVCGTMSYALKCITVNGSSLTISGPNSICAGSSATLTASGAMGYTWVPVNQFGASIVVTPTATTCYTVVGYNPTCGTNSFGFKCITVGSGSVLTISGPSVICAGSTATLVASGASSYTWQPGSLFGGAIAVTPTANTCYTVSGYDPVCGGLISGVKCIAVNSGSVLTISGPSVVCAGNSATLSATGATSIIWQPGSLFGNTVVITPSANTCYTATGYNPSCGSSSAVKCITVGGSTLAVSGPNYLCTGTSATLTATGAASYTWQPGNLTGASVVVTPSASICYTVSGYNPTCNTIDSGVQCITVGTGSVLTVSGPSVICLGNTANLTASGASSYTWQPGSLFGPNVAVSPTVNTCYTVSAYNPVCGTIDYAVKCITVSNSVIAISGPSVVCAGTSATLLATGATSVLWQPGSLFGNTVVITPSANTCYTATGYNPSCGSSSAIKCITVGGSTLAVSGPNYLCTGTSATLTAVGAASYTWQPGNLTGASVVVTPTASTCYTVSGYNPTCNTIDSGVKCITVGTGSVLTVSGPSVVCAGSTATLVASGAASYTWQPGSLFGAVIAVTPTANTCYTVSAYNPTCGNISSAVKCIAVGGSSTLTVSGPNSICAGSTATLVASGAASYTWQPGNLFGAAIAVTPTANTCYTVSGYDPTCGTIKYGFICITVNTGSALTVSGPSVVCAGSSATLLATGATSIMWQPGSLFGNTVVVTPTATTCYTVSGYDPMCGTMSYAVKCITVGSPSLTISGPNSICAGSSATLTASGAMGYTWVPVNQFGASIVVTPTATTCYTVVGYNPTCGTNSFGFKCITVGSGSVVTISGPSVVCAGNSATLTATGATSLIWQPGNLFGNTVVVTPTATTCYTVSGYDPTCGTFNSGVKCLAVQAPPVLTTGGSSVICPGSGALLSVTGALTYTWVPGNLTGSVIAVSPAVSTCYTVVGTGPNGCIGVSNRCITVSGGTVITVSGPSVVCSGNTATLVASGAASYTWQPGNLFGAAVAVTPTANTCYTVSGYDPTCGTINYGVKCITVNGGSALTISGPSVICAGSSATLTATGATSLMWQPGSLFGASVVVTPTATTCYTVSGYEPMCGTFNSAVKCISVNSGSMLTISGPSVVCAGSSATLTATGATSLMWQPGSLFGASVVVTPTAATCYTVSGYEPMCGTFNSAVKCITAVGSGSMLTISGPNTICAGSSAILTASGAASYTWMPGSLFGASVVVTPTASTCYTALGYNAVCNTIDYGVKCITVGAGSSLTVSGPSVVCAGSSVALFATGATSLMWQPGSLYGSTVVVTPTANTCYTVSGYNPTCGTMSSAVKCIQVSYGPALTAMTNNGIICAGNSATLLASGAVSYTWNTGSSSPAIVVSPTVNTMYLVTGADAQGCVSSATVVQQVSPCTGITTVARQNLSISVYPNPAQNNITMQSEVTGNVNYVVCDVTGREIDKGSFAETKMLDVSAYASGSYIIRFESASGTVYKKVVVNK